MLSFSPGTANVSTTSWLRQAGARREAGGTTLLVLVSPFKAERAIGDGGAAPNLALFGSVILVLRGTGGRRHVRGDEEKEQEGETGEFVLLSGTEEHGHVLRSIESERARKKSEGRVFFPGDPHFFRYRKRRKKRDSALSPFSLSVSASFTHSLLSREEARRFLQAFCLLPASSSSREEREKGQRDKSALKKKERRRRFPPKNASFPVRRQRPSSSLLSPRPRRGKDTERDCTHAGDVAPASSGLPAAGIGRIDCDAVADGGGDERGRTAFPGGAGPKPPPPPPPPPPLSPRRVALRRRGRCSREGCCCRCRRCCLRC